MNFLVVFSLTDGFTLNIGYWKLIGAPFIVLVFAVFVLWLIFKYVKKPAGWSNLAWLIVYSLFALVFSAACYFFLFPPLASLPL